MSEPNSLLFVWIAWDDLLEWAKRKTRVAAWSHYLDVYLNPGALNASAGDCPRELIRAHGGR